MGRRRHPPPGTPDDDDAGTVSPVDVDTLAFTTVVAPEVLQARKRRDRPQQRRRRRKLTDTATRDTRQAHQLNK